MSGKKPLVLSREEVRSIDRAAIEQLGLPGTLLMENAARGVAEVVLQHGTSRIVIVCGPGNNGGDGIALARQLASVGIPVELFLMPASRGLSADNQFNLDVWKKAGGACTVINSQGAIDSFCVALTSLPEDALIVDCLLGTGTKGAPRSPFREVISAMNSSAASIVAVDVPSGLDCDAGHADGVAVFAARTVSFVGRKKGFDHPESQRYTGEVTVAHIGIPLSWIIQWLENYRDSAASAASDKSAN